MTGLPPLSDLELRDLREPSPLAIGGMDQSLTSFGFARVCGGQAKAWRVETGKLRGDERLEVLLEHVRDAAMGLDVVIVEGLAQKAAGSSLLDLAGLLALVGHELWKMRVPYVVVSPYRRAAYITGKASSPKDQCLAAAIKRFAPVADLTGNDEADAMTLAHMGADHYGCPLVKMPADRIEGLHAVHPKNTVRARKGDPIINWPQISRETA